MSLKPDEFQGFRKQALTKRQQQHQRARNLEVITVQEIAERLRTTSLYSGKTTNQSFKDV